jgi:hypothetical protein
VNSQPPDGELALPAHHRVKNGKIAQQLAGGKGGKVPARRDVHPRQDATELDGQLEELGSAILKDDREADDARPGERRLLRHGVHVVGGAKGSQLDRVAVLAQHGRQVASAQVL